MTHLTHPTPHTSCPLVDLQMVNITLRVLSEPDMERLPTIFKTLGMDYDEIVLPSIVNETLKSVVAQFNAAQLCRCPVQRGPIDHPT